ncbi:hypothetical protein DR105_03730 [Mycoplasma hyorhinis]|nr:hypothetical protein [Mesomycoplasma hyorhinis]
MVISTLNKILKEDKLQANKTCNINIYIDQAPENKKEEKEEGAEKDIKLESFIKKEIENLLNNNNVSMLPIQNVKVEYVNSKGKNPKNKSIRIADFIANISNYYLRDILNSLPKVLKCNNLKPLKYNKIKNFLCSIYNHTLIQKDYENLES